MTPACIRPYHRLLEIFFPSHEPNAELHATHFVCSLPPVLMVVLVVVVVMVVGVAVMAAVMVMMSLYLRLGFLLLHRLQLYRLFFHAPVVVFGGGACILAQKRDPWLSNVFPTMVNKIPWAGPPCRPFVPNKMSPSGAAGDGPTRDSAHPWQTFWPSGYPFVQENAFRLKSGDGGGDGGGGGGVVERQPHAGR